MFHINIDTSAIVRAVIDNGSGTPVYPASAYSAGTLMGSPGVWSRSPK